MEYRINNILKDLREERERKVELVYNHKRFYDANIILILNELIFYFENATICSPIENEQDFIGFEDVLDLFSQYYVAEGINRRMSKNDDYDFSYNNILDWTGYLLENKKYLVEKEDYYA